MDFSAYPNIMAKANELGGIKKTVFNKKLLQTTEQNWAGLTPNEVASIDAQLPSASKVLTAYVTPTAIIVMNRNEHVLDVILVRDIIWVYAHVTRNSVNFIPYSKEHEVRIITRDGVVHIIGKITKIIFSRKDIGGEAVNAIAQAIDPYRKGIIYGWSKEIQEAFAKRFVEVIQSVDNQNIIMQ